MFNFKSFLVLASLPVLFVGCDTFEVLSKKTAQPANIKIDFVVQKPSKSIRPVGLTPDLYLSQIDLSKFKITEDGKKLSLSEGGRAGVEKCGDCAINLIKLTLDFSGSVRDQYDVMIGNTIAFLETLKKTQVESLINVNFFAGEVGLYEPKGMPVYLKPDVMIGFLRQATCSSFHLTSEEYVMDERGPQTLCDADTATRLNTSIVKMLERLNNPSMVVETIKGKKIIKTAILFTDGMGRDKGVTVEQVKSEVANFKSNGGLFYSVIMDSDEDNAKFFKEIAPTKRFTLKKITKLSEKLNDVLDDVQEEIPLFFTLKICSAVRGGPATLKVSSLKYNVPEISFKYDTTNFKGGCNLQNKEQWKF